MRKYRMVSQNNVDIDSILRDWFSAKGYDSLFIRRIERENGIVTTVFVAEYFYLRISSNVVLTVIVEKTDDVTVVDIVAGGGTCFGIFRIPSGAEYSACKRIVNLLEENGFTI